MKKLIIILGVVIMIVAARTAFSQASEGIITFEVRVNNHRMLAPGQEDRKAMIPEYRIFKEQLFFNADESLFKPLIEDEDEEEQGPGGGRRFRFQMKTQIYTAHTSGKVVTMQDMRGKNYLIQDSVKVSPWKFGSEQKVVLGYTCKQAFYTDSLKQVITAWYTDKLRPFLGPERFNTLPGAVLAVDINNGQRVLVATKIDLKPLKSSDVKEPSSGEKISPATFRKMMEEQRKNFQNGGGGRSGFRN